MMLLDFVTSNPTIAAKLLRDGWEEQSAGYCVGARLFRWRNWAQGWPPDPLKKTGRTVVELASDEWFPFVVGSFRDLWPNREPHYRVEPPHPAPCPDPYCERGATCPRCRGLR